MANSDCATVLKRGYLIDKKAGLLERKKWFVLRQDHRRGYCILENYKDEKSALKGETPKGFVNVFDVVEVLRLSDKKQCFQLLCPGIAHRLMANSEAEADEWADCIRKQILYRRDIGFPIQRIMSHSSAGNNSPLSSSPPNFTSTAGSHLQLSNLHQSTQGIMTSSNATLYIPPPSCDSQTTITQSYPTPPESVVTSVGAVAGSFQKQNSLELYHPYPSPPSSDNSSLYNGSNTSFDNTAPVFDSDYEKLKFRVHVKESDRLLVSGPCDLLINEDCIGLYLIQSGQLVGTWPIHAIRRYGVNSVCFTFETGRNCFTGEGRFFFYSPQSRLIHSHVHRVAQRLTKEHRRSSAPEATVYKTSSAVHVSQTLPPSFVQKQLVGNYRSPCLDLSMPSLPTTYNHIEHTLHRPPLSTIEPYSRIGNHTPTHTSTTPSYLPEYEKLNHKYRPSPPLMHHSNTIPLMNQTPTSSSTLNYVTIQHEEDSPIYSNIKFTVSEENEENDEEDENDVVSDSDRPPPLPPRLMKLNSA